MIVTKMIYARYTAVAMLLFGPVARTTPPDSDEKTAVAFQVVTDKMAYTPGSTLRVKFIVTNTSKSPLYLFRNLSECSNPKGSFFFLILDSKNHDVRSQGCSSDSWPPEEDVANLSDTLRWVRLNPGEIFGREFTFGLPNKKGTYRLKAELTPTTFTGSQKEVLSRNQTRVLDKPYPAPIVTITIR